jgi:hypothetical protein
MTYVAYAESEAEAKEFVDDAMRDASPSEFDAHARPLVQLVKSGGMFEKRYSIPSGWATRSLVYGTDDDSTLGELLDKEMEGFKNE